ncbi:hypothetical protein GH714_006809 [Hevea brasiliensis]|uniref:SHSP domain-containing protein n=1 Tax=Hevea brasiliensis TaxID=3981 RepID=A0A6A6LF23_HEVBR|nr:hypothetical protein GH714_006809 [Hevea brasiliensis]
MAHLNHVDEDFEPTTEWAKDAAFDTLFVYLPGGILKIKHPKINKQATTPQENASAAGTPELQKSGRDQAAQQVPSKIKIDKETSRNNVDENAASQNIPDEEKGLRDASGKNSSSETVANNVSGKTLEDKKSEGLIEAGKMTSTSDTETEMKKPKKSTKLVVAAGFLVLAIGLYVKSALKSEE